MKQTVVDLSMARTRLFSQRSGADIAQAAGGTCRIAALESNVKSAALALLADRTPLEGEALRRWLDV